MADDPRITYARPPVVEVVAAVAFQRLPDSLTVQFGRLWERSLRTEFPKVEQQPPYVVPIERFGPEARLPNLAAELLQEYPFPRFWFLSAAGDELLQLQRDWFACNWRKVEPGGNYDRWSSRRDAFEQWFRALDEFATSEGAGPLAPVQCEVTYINHVLPNNEWKDHGELHRILRLASLVSEMPLQQEQTSVLNQFLMKDESGQPFGRLHLSARPALRRDETPIFLIELTARGRPLTSNLAGVLDFLDRGREMIVRTFAAVTTEDIQREWGREQ